MTGDTDIWHIAAERRQEALASGALAPIGTTVERVRDRGVDFVVRRVESMAAKPKGNDRSGKDPFAPPYDPALWVGEVPPAHLALLNKFPVLERHLLLVTRDYEAQESLLTEADFAAWLEVMGKEEVLGFYNGGPEAGASQPHKHLQAVPLPLGPNGVPVPVEPHLGRLPFLHAFVELDDTRRGEPAALHRCYQALWRECGFAPERNRQPVPYNLLLTRRRMWLVPRTQDSVEGIEVNGLGFAGALLARDEAQVELIRRIGPIEVLRRVTHPCETGQVE
jgi:ATP adenylyltransferase